MRITQRTQRAWLRWCSTLGQTYVRCTQMPALGSVGTHRANCLLFHRKAVKAERPRDCRDLSDAFFSIICMCVIPCVTNKWITTCPSTRALSPSQRPPWRSMLLCFKATLLTLLLSSLIYVSCKLSTFIACMSCHVCHILCMSCVRTGNMSWWMYVMYDAIMYQHRFFRW